MIGLQGIMHFTQWNVRWVFWTNAFIMFVMLQERSLVKGVEWVHGLFLFPLVLGCTPLINRVRGQVASQRFEIDYLAAIPCLSKCQKNVENGVDALVFFMLDVLYC